MLRRNEAALSARSASPGHWNKLRRIATNNIVMRRTVGFLTVFLLTISASSALETRFMQGLGDTRYQPVDSDVIGRRFHVYIMLPESY